ncbi:hypothetical protein J0A71_04g09800 [Encephalitozoon cuniculi]|nr:hypothetical protein J0A71_04g09800 [Encephalitozoon cuniculi]
MRIQKYKRRISIGLIMKAKFIALQAIFTAVLCTQQQECGHSGSIVENSKEKKKLPVPIPGTEEQQELSTGKKENPIVEEGTSGNEGSGQSENSQEGEEEEEEGLVDNEGD